MDLTAIQKLIDSLATALTQIAELQAQAQDAQVLLDIEVKKAFDAGFAAGVASVADKVYTQAELDAAVVAAVTPVQAELEVVKAELEALKVDVDVKITEAVASAVSALKAQLKAAYDAQQVAETEGETGFAKLLEVEASPVVE